ncbi:MAG TPA: metallophosphoesterase [Chitinophaga sp.]|nr:metallophosphoesterase [Chitinophaga sp.]
MKKLFQRPIIWLSKLVSSNPDRKLVFNSLSQLYKQISTGKVEKGIVLPCDPEKTSIIIFSDQHKGGRDGSDDFMRAEPNYLAALNYYYEKGFTFVNLGDCEELWENPPSVVLEKNRAALLEESRFLQQDRYYRIFGNHDLEWAYAIPKDQFLKPLFGKKLKVYEGLILRMPYSSNNFDIFLTHGHQGDQRSDGNAFSKWFVAAIWTPIQRFFDIKLDTISDNFDLVDKHNVIMYEWSQQLSNTLLISGHTHKPVFASMDHIDRLTKQMLKAREKGNDAEILLLQSAIEKRQAEYAGKQFIKTMVSPTYFNTGCCCFSDGDITGIEITEGFIRLIKWEEDANGGSSRKVLEESPLFYLFDQLQHSGT